MFRSALAQQGKNCLTQRVATTAARKSLSTAAVQLSNLVQQNPHMDVVKYQHKNRVWSLGHVNYYSDAVAIGLCELGLQPGDIVLSWLPNHFQEQMVLQFACSKSGLIFYTLDPAIATTDREAAKQALAKALELSKANVLVSQEAGQDVNYITLAESVIPELRIFDQALGMPFVTPRFPHLRVPIQTGFDQDDKEGWVQLRQMVVPSGNLHTHINVNELNGQTPLAGTFELDTSGKPTKLGKTLSNDEVVKGKVWPTFSSILNKEFHEVAGVGVIF